MPTRHWPRRQTQPSRPTPSFKLLRTHSLKPRHTHQRWRKRLLGHWPTHALLASMLPPNPSASDGQQNALETKVNTADEKRAGVQQRLADLEPQVAGREMSADRLGEIERQSKAAADTSRQADQLAAKLETKLSTYRKTSKHAPRCCRRRTSCRRHSRSQRSSRRT